MKPVCILVAALGGEGGSVLADWLVNAATAAGFPVQTTSVPGVAQRTGATTYYIEIFPRTRKDLDGREPVLSLTPTPGHIDLVAATELVEAGRTVQLGYVDPGRTVLVASTHREYAVSEKSAMADGRYDGTRVTAAATQRSLRSIMFDMRVLALDQGTVINTVLFGAMAASGVLPFGRAACEEAIRATGRAVQSSLRGFAAGFEAAAGRVAAADGFSATMRASAELSPRVRALPAALHDIAAAGVRLCAGYQDAPYADLYLDRVEKLLASEQRFGGSAVDATREAARYLALWMCYEDVIRVAQLKTRRERLARVREEVGAGDGDLLRVTEYLKPGLDEIASLLPPAGAAWLNAGAAGKTWHKNLLLRTDTIRGFLMLCMLRALRPLRRRTSRYALENTAIERWLAAVDGAMRTPMALELALCGNLVKGYGETNRRGHRNLTAILAQALAGANAGDVRTARLAALADPERHQQPAAPAPSVIKPIAIVRRKSHT